MAVHSATCEKNMIIQLKLILETLSSVGIEEAIIEPSDNGGTIIRAANAAGNILIYDEIDDRISESPMGVQSVRGLLSRIQLFDADKCTASLEDGGDFIRDIKIKQGRKSATFRFCPPKNIHALKTVPNSTKSEVLTISKEYVKYLMQAITAMSFTGDKEERTISLHGTNKGMSVKISDGEDDSFDEVVESVVGETTAGSWEVIPFQKVMSKSSEYNTTDKSASFVIDDLGIITFDLSFIKVMIAPMAS